MSPSIDQKKPEKPEKPGNLTADDHPLEPASTNKLSGEVSANDRVEESRAFSRFSVHRPAPINLPSDPKLATAAVLAYINGDDGIDRAAAIEAMTARATLLAVADSDDALESLAEHLPVLNALFLRFSAEAIAAKAPDHRAKLVKIALSSQTAYARTQALIAGLRLQRQGKAKVVVEDDS
jgi:hypothetical protein